MNEWQFLAALAVPIIGFLGAVAQRERTPAQVKRLREAVSALKELPVRSEAHEAVSALVVQQAQNLTERESRRLNVTNLIMSIILGVVVGFVSYLLIIGSVAAWPMPWGWVVVTVSAIVGLMLMLFVGAAFGTIFNPPGSAREKRRPRDAGGAEAEGIQ